MRQLLRLQTLIDVVYGILLFRLFLFLPSPEVDGFGAKDLIYVLQNSYINYLAIVIGVIMIIVYWVQSNIQFGYLQQTRTPHIIISILQVMFLLIYLYFVRLNLQFDNVLQIDGVIILLQMQSIFLALSGLMSVAGWRYAVIHKLVTDSISTEEKKNVYLRLMPEPIVSLLTFPFAYFGPEAWTASWLLLIPVTMISKRIINRNQTTMKN